MIRKFLDLSTAHVSPAARHWLEGVCHLNALGKQESPYPNAGATLYGWALYAPVPSEFDGHCLHPDLYDVAEVARANECDWILFDADGDIMDGLPQFMEEDGDDGLTDEEKAALDMVAKDIAALPLTVRRKIEADDAGLADELAEPGELDAMVRMTTAGEKSAEEPPTVFASNPEGADIVHGGSIDEYLAQHGGMHLAASGIKVLLERAGVDCALIDTIMARLAEGAKAKLELRRLAAL